MKSLAQILALSLAGTLGAQSPLSLFEANNTLGVPAQMFFDLTVTNPITIHALDLNLNGGGSGTVQVFLGNGITTYVGSETNIGNWTPVALGSATSNGFNTPTPVCFNTPIQLAPGDYAVAIAHSGTLIPTYFGNAANPATPVSNADLTLTPGAAQQNPFSATGALIAGRRFAGNIYYFPGLGVPAGVACGIATAENIEYGGGCFRVEESFWDIRDTPEATLLSGNSLTLVPNAGTYLPLWVPSSLYIPPTAGATVLTGFTTGGIVNNDDGDLGITLPQPFTLADGTQVTTLTVHSNGMVSTASNEDFINTNNSALYFGGGAVPAGQSLSWFPGAVTLLDMPNEVWGIWHDFNAAEAGSGSIKTELSGTIFCVTWDGVESYPDATPNPSTVQLQFELGTGGTPGNVTYVLEDINATGIGGGDASDAYNISYSPGGDSVFHGESDVTAFDGTIVLGPDDLPLQLSANSRPVIGSTVRYLTTEEPAPGVGLHFVSLAPSAGFDPFLLSLTDAPGCELLIDNTQGEGFLILTGAAFFDFPYPAAPAIAGLPIYNQSIWLFSAGGALISEMSNGVESIIGIQ